MRLHKPERRVDDDLHLVPPAARFIDDFLLACAHPLSRADPATHWTRDQLCAFVRDHPDGHFGHCRGERWPGYHLWMRLAPATRPAVPFAGTVSFRIGNDDDLIRYWGHVGYGVYPPARGRHYAERAVRLILPLAERHGLRELWITTNPDNAASRRTCERLGATFVETVVVPDDHPLALRGEHRKCRYRLPL